MDEFKNKKCVDCGKIFPATLEFFYKKKNGLYGISNICKKCDNLRRKKNMNNRKKEGVHIISTSVSKEEYEESLIRAKKMNLNISDYLKLSLLQNNCKYMISIDKNLTDNEAYELSKIGTNINQIAHFCNGHNKIYSSDIKYLRELMEQCWKVIDKMYDKIDDVNNLALEILKGREYVEHSNSQSNK